MTKNQFLTLKPGYEVRIANKPTVHGYVGRIVKVVGLGRVSSQVRHVVVKVDDRNLHLFADEVSFVK